jgi:hypothetical protein
LKLNECGALAFSDDGSLSNDEEEVRLRRTTNARGYDLNRIYTWDVPLRASSTRLYVGVGTGHSYLGTMLVNYQLPTTTAAKLISLSVVPVTHDLLDVQYYSRCHQRMNSSKLK